MTATLRHLWAVQPVVRRVKGAIVGVVALLMVGCGAQGATSMPRVASALEATKHLWRASCEPVPAGKEAFCSESKDGIGTLVEFYTSLNEELPQ